MLFRDKLHPNTKTSRDIFFVDPAVPGIQFLPLVLVPTPPKKKILNQLNLQQLQHGKRETGDMRQETADVRLETGDGRQKMGDRIRETVDVRQEM